MASISNNSGIGNRNSLFEELSRDTLEHSNEVIFIVDRHLRIAYCNPAWDRFALNNGGEDVVAARVLSTDLMSVIPEPLFDFYSQVFQRCSQCPLAFDLDYECSSPELFRLLHMNILPLRRSGGLAFINSLRVEHIHGAERPVWPVSDIYFSPDRMITMCCHCQRTRRRDASQAWDWVPEFVRTRSWRVSHGICPVCKSYFYSKYFTTGSGCAS